MNPPDDHEIVENVVVGADEAKKHNLADTIYIHYEKIPPPPKIRIKNKFKNLTGSRDDAAKKYRNKRSRILYHVVIKYSPPTGTTHRTHPLT